MLKFVHKKHVNKNSDGKIVIYYNLSDIILGFLLVVLVGFFIYNYLRFSLVPPSQASYTYPIQASLMKRR